MSTSSGCRLIRRLFWRGKKVASEIMTKYSCCRSVGETAMSHRGHRNFGENHGGGGVFARPMVKPVPLAGQSLVSVPTKETTIGGEYDSLVAVSSQNQTVGRISPSLRTRLGSYPESLPLMTLNSERQSHSGSAFLRRETDFSLSTPE